jgi:hypothetical protein
MKKEQQRTKSNVVKERAHDAKGNHKFPNESYVPPPRFLDQLAVHAIRSDSHFRKIREQIREQNLFWQPACKKMVPRTFSSLILTSVFLLSAIVLLKDQPSYVASIRLIMPDR